MLWSGWGWLNSTLAGSRGRVWLNSRASISNTLELCYAVVKMGLAELNAGWLKGTGVVELTGKHFQSPRVLLCCGQDGAG